MAESVFQVTKGTAAERKVFARARRRTDFPWEVLRPGMKKRGIDVIEVAFENAPVLDDRFWGFAQTDIGRLTLKPGVKPSSIQIIAIHEMFHFADALWFRDAKRNDLHALYHGGKKPNHGFYEPDPDADASPGALGPGKPYYRECQEGWMSDAVAIFSDLRWPHSVFADYTHELPRSLYAEARAIALRTPGAAEPEPTPTPQPPPTPAPDREKERLLADLEDALERADAAEDALEARLEHAGLVRASIAELSQLAAR